LSRLRASSHETIPVDRLYAGDHWSVVRSLAGQTAPAGAVTRVWVCSAGYGLLPWTSRIAPYSATFSRGELDSVLRDVRIESWASSVQRWWETLARWEGPEPGTPRTVAGLVRAFPGDLFLVALSGPYLTALSADLGAAGRALEDQRRLSILSAGAKPADGLEGYMVPCSARLQPCVGGTLTSLNVRLARMALADLGETEPTLPALRHYFTRLLNAPAHPPRARRAAVTDDQVKAYIRAALRQDVQGRPTRLLARLRGEGRACEQSRFMSLFHTIEEEFHGK
jgi:hypothetical protein